MFWLADCSFRHCSALDAGSEFTAGARKRLLVFKPLVFGTATAFAVDTLVNSLVFDERNASRFSGNLLWKLKIFMVKSVYFDLIKMIDYLIKASVTTCQF